jgi:hypothetical protein
MAALLVACGILAYLYLHPGSDVFRVYNSPAGQYHLIVYRYHSSLPAMPGDASGNGGYVRLYDTYGKLYGEAKLALITAASAPSGVKWDEGEVSLPGAFDFHLPRESK